MKIVDIELRKVKDRKKVVVVLSMSGYRELNVTAQILTRVYCTSFHLPENDWCSVNTQWF